ncbi:MAG TPA: beta-N-acetylhexosaminidase [Devosiaceae bacterium]|nr:beta-N-acetylhexosaminidase [Devosiaceae bacterium]
MSQVRLETRWTPVQEGAASLYELTLTNDGSAAISGFRLCISGPARIDPAASIEGGTLVARLSNHAELAPPEGFVLAPGESWTVAVRGPVALRHWNDGARAAYLALADGSALPVAVSPTVAGGEDTPPKAGTQRYPVPVAAPVDIAVIPWPAKIAVSGGRGAPAGLAPEGESPAAKEAIAAFAELTAALFPAEGIFRPVTEGGAAVRLELAGEMRPEAYRIGFAGTAVSIEAATRTGFLYGLITLGQILRGARQNPETFIFPTEGEIEDAPTHGWRGAMLDVARQFYSTGEVGRFLRLMAWNKLNRFHWHLADDEAWRIEIEAFPQLTAIGAWRGHGLQLPSLLGSGMERQGGYYSKAAIRDIVRLAEGLGITVVPEIDVPGHCYAMLAALPELRDPGETGTYVSVQGFPNNCLNPAHEKTYEAVEKVFDEVIALFPSRIVHVGADEVPLGAWSGSPLALEKLREIGGEELAADHAKRLNVLTNGHGADEIDGSGAAALQAIFLKRIQAFLASRGCVTGGWQEAAHGDVIDKDRVYLVGWRTVEVSAALAGRGYDMVVAPGQAYYLDMAQSEEWSEPGAGWAGWSSLEKTYEFEATAGWSEAQLEHLLGVQACIWSEPMADHAVFDRLVFPRLSAVAEAGWTEPGRKSFERFAALCGLMPNLYGFWSV